MLCTHFLFMKYIILKTNNMLSNISGAAFDQKVTIFNIKCKNKNFRILKHQQKRYFKNKKKCTYNFSR